MLDYFQLRSPNLKNEFLSGLTVALALVPEAIAFAFVAGVSPIIGLYSAIFIGFITAVFGGRPGMISGATGAMAVVVVALVAIHGIEYLFPAVILCGLIQIFVGLGRLGMLIRMVPHSVMIGFVNGLAIVIFMAQFGSFKTADAAGKLMYIQGPSLWIMLGLTALTMAIIWLLPKFTKAVPASLAAILVVSVIAIGLNKALDTTYAAEGQKNVVMNVGDLVSTNLRAKEARDAIAASEAVMSAPVTVNTTDLAIQATDSVIGPVGGQSSVQAPVIAPQATPLEAPVKPDPKPAASAISAGLPMPFFMEYVVPPMTWTTLWIVFPFALTLAGVGLIESLMTMTLIDEITETRGQGNRECIGQGAANIVCGFFGGMGGCAMIGQSLINVNSGGRGRMSGITAAVCLLMFVLFLGPWIELIPIAALVGVMFMVVIGTFEWASVQIFNKVPLADYAVMVIVTGYTVIMHDLASAVIIGVIVSALVFSWQHAKHIGVDIKHTENGAKVYQLHGPLFFASVNSFMSLFDPKDDPTEVVIDFYYTRVYDQSGLQAINNLAEKYRAQGKHLQLMHLSPECRQLLDKAGDLVVVNRSEDPHYHIATDKLA